MTELRHRMGSAPGRTLPALAYVDVEHHEREMVDIWYREWLYVCRADTLGAARSFRTFEVGDQSVLLVRDDAGVLRGFHNTCRHRGSLLCDAPSGVLGSRRITCPYHNWSYSLSGELRSTPFNDVDEMEQLSLYPVAVAEWRGMVFVNLAADEAGELADSMDPGPALLDRWPLETLVTGHTFVIDLACNWKVFWENFLECYHCPGVHPELCDLVPLYRRGVVSADMAGDGWIGEGLRAGAATWSMDGRLCGPPFPELTDDEIAAGYTFLTVLPTMFVVAHPDHVRIVSLSPLGVAGTRLTAEWLFAPETLAHEGFDMGNVTEFGALVMTQDAAVCELNQRGLRSIRHEHGRLMPNEKDIALFYRWLDRRIGPGSKRGTAAGGRVTSRAAIGPARHEDHDRWRLLWDAYLVFYESELSPGHADRLWARIHDGSDPIEAMVATVDNAAVGLVHFLPHADTWSGAMACYLQDLYVDEHHRGEGIGEDLIAAVQTRAQERGWAYVYWQTAEDNERARRLYDKLTGGRTRFVLYQLDVEGGP